MTAQIGCCGSAFQHARPHILHETSGDRIAMIFLTGMHTNLSESPEQLPFRLWQTFLESHQAPGLKGVELLPALEVCAAW